MYVLLVSSGILSFLSSLCQCVLSFCLILFAFCTPFMSCFVPSCAVSCLFLIWLAHGQPTVHSLQYVLIFFFLHLSFDSLRIYHLFNAKDYYQYYYHHLEGAEPLPFIRTTQGAWATILTQASESATPHCEGTFDDQVIQVLLTQYIAPKDSLVKR